jgi:hypothetical protein
MVILEGQCKNWRSQRFKEKFPGTKKGYFIANLLSSAAILE